MKNKELLEKVRRLLKEIMYGMPRENIIKENIDIVIDELLK